MEQTDNTYQHQTRCNASFGIMTLVIGGIVVAFAITLYLFIGL